MLDWLSLLETGVTYITNNNEEESTLNGTVDQINREEAKSDVNMEEYIEKKQVDWSGFTMNDVYNQDNMVEMDVTPAQEAYDKMFGHKETFLPKKRNLYEALASEDGFHRFGQRKHFIDPFSEETQALITLPTDENLSNKVDFA